MNPDLAMDDELLKKTGTGNLFMVFGELDMDVAKQKDGNLTVTIKGGDVYDPTTGQTAASYPPLASHFVVTVLLHSAHVLVRFGARNVVLTVTWQTCKIACVYAVGMHIYARSRKPLVWLRPPPSAPFIFFKSSETSFPLAA